ncbi:hypothetical protein PAPYR_5386 [Paratrimastix pyriformis]|uniref:F-box domain-containing protein n=1 Tax=Paratrimastix pyriformis TaxID=342808 RepID=A0ABQ8UKB4_9EUKA|nr:hypothetical protein PAPYR_5386 [Paratrimastix pyriformis]
MDLMCEALSILPSELKCCILSYLNPPDIAQMLLVNHEFSRLGHCDTVWQAICLRILPGVQHYRSTWLSEVSWKDFFRIIQNPWDPACFLQQETALCPAQLAVRKIGSSNHSFQCSRGYHRGTHYWEVRVDALHSTDVFVGICPDGVLTTTTWLADCPGAVCYNQSGRIYLRARPSPWGCASAEGTQSGCCSASRPQLHPTLALHSPLLRSPYPSPRPIPAAAAPAVSFFVNGACQTTITGLPWARYVPAASLLYPGDALTLLWHPTVRPPPLERVAPPEISTTASAQPPPPEGPLSLGPRAPEVEALPGPVAPAPERSLADPPTLEPPVPNG